ncbi:MAG: xanthine dehydrogenase accessory protein XdhC [Candidatus Protistobacter heckmanni]|nr:xanthine dehydrogenase accessory protein XdhC [Candidatus Protistobacter heckmanni]
MSRLPAWLQTLAECNARGEPAVLVGVERTEGSAPRRAGARMVFSAAAQADTIGGGHLEWKAAEVARGMLSAAAPQDDGPASRLVKRFPLGPSLCQCCGGVEHLSFELKRPGAALSARIAAEAKAHAASRPHVVLFGAGHVGQALIHQLADLDCEVTWADEREALFPAGLPAQIRVEATDLLEPVVDEAPAGSNFLVMTHEHSLDLALSQGILERMRERGNVAWFGLIGSATKRAQFERRLAERGIGPSLLAAMTCPIGIPGIRGKEPELIALAVAAQLAGLWEERAARAADEFSS